MLDILRIDPFKEAHGLFRDFDRLMKEFLVADFDPAGHSGWLPDIRVENTDDGHEVSVDLPGVDPKDVEISVRDRRLVIKGARRFGKGGEKAAFSRSFSRTFSLPESADPEGIQASAENGVLVVRIPKKPEAKPRQIEVKIGEQKQLT